MLQFKASKLAVYVAVTVLTIGGTRSASAGAYVLTDLGYLARWHLQSGHRDQ